ncbi:MAG: hypothetical protein R3B54_11255 [Bdellovibrionota bacterium]
MRRVLVTLGCLVYSASAFSIGTGHNVYSYGSARPAADEAAIQSLLNQASSCGLDRNFVAPYLNRGAVNAAPPVSALPPAPPAFPTAPVLTPPAAPPVAPPGPVGETVSDDSTKEPVASKAKEEVTTSTPSSSSTNSSSTVSEPSSATDSTPAKKVVADNGPKPKDPKPETHKEAKAHFLSADGFPRRAVWAYPKENSTLWYFWNGSDWQCT